MFREIFVSLEASAPILVGLSGGADSICLLDLLLPWARDRHIPVIPIHIDHGWRPESGKQAAQLALTVIEKFGLALQIVKIEGLDLSLGNLEERSREQRFEIFQKVYQERGAQALFLGHHADDQAETLLKRLFEGAGLLGLQGIHRERFFKGMRILRPLLGWTKNRILDHLSQRDLPYIIDPTNEDSRFLRGKMRSGLFETIEKAFGKQIRAPLSALAEEVSLWEGWVREELMILWKKTVIGPLGAMIPLEILEVHPALKRLFFKELCNHFGLTAPRAFLDRLEKLSSLKPGKKLQLGPMDWILGKGKIYLIYSDFIVEICEGEAAKEASLEALFLGICAKKVAIDGDLVMPNATMRVSEKLFLVEWFRKRQIPLELAMRFPVYQEKENGYVTDFLTEDKEVTSKTKKRVVISCRSSVINKIK